LVSIRFIPRTILSIEPSSSPKNAKTKEIHHTDIRLTWDYPQDYKVYAISGYSIRYRKTDREEWTKGKMLSANQNTGKIEDLQSSTKYEIMVIAHNDYGEGQSDIISAETTGKDHS
jgi:DNA polymerase elongation subunit (family B)